MAQPEPELPDEHPERNLRQRLEIVVRSLEQAIQELRQAMERPGPAGPAGVLKE